MARVAPRGGPNKVTSHAPVTSEQAWNKMASGAGYSGTISELLY